MSSPASIDAFTEKVYSRPEFVPPPPGHCLGAVVDGKAIPCSDCSSFRAADPSGHTCVCGHLIVRHKRMWEAVAFTAGAAVPPAGPCCGPAANGKVLGPCDVQCEAYREVGKVGGVPMCVCGHPIIRHKFMIVKPGFVSMIAALFRSEDPPASSASTSSVAAPLHPQPSSPTQSDDSSQEEEDRYARLPPRLGLRHRKRLGAVGFPRI